MQVDFSILRSSEQGRLLTAIVVPRPIARTTTVSADGAADADAPTTRSICRASRLWTGTGCRRRMSGSVQHFHGERSSEATASGMRLPVGMAEHFAINPAP
jgi:hypothetical protein